MESSTASLLLTILFDLVIGLLVLMCFPLIRKCRGDKRRVRVQSTENMPARLAAVATPHRKVSLDSFNEHDAFLNSMMLYNAPKLVRL